MLGRFIYNVYAVTRAYFQPSIAPKPPAEDIPPTGTILKEVLDFICPTFSD